jgi:hypothetical protein
MRASFKNWMPAVDKVNMFWSNDGHLYVPILSPEAFWKPDGNLNDKYEYITNQHSITSKLQQPTIRWRNCALHCNFNIISRPIFICRLTFYQPASRFLLRSVVSRLLLGCFKSFGTFVLPGWLSSYEYRN